MSAGPSPPGVVVAIDGPAGVGKSSVARRVAQALGLPYVDTGAMYRAMGWKAYSSRIDPGDPAAVAALVAASDLDLRPRSDGTVEVLLDGEPVASHIRDLAVGAMASRLAQRPEVRARLVELQRAFGEAHGAVMEGRDIGTVVFPRTPFKFFLDARPEVRVARRLAQLREAGRSPAPVEGEVAAELEQRDRRDRERALSPLSWDPSYERIDTSDLSAVDVVDLITQRVRGAAAAERRGGVAAPG